MPIFAELRLGKSYVRYMKNGKILYGGKNGHQLFLRVMNYAYFFGHGDPLPGMVAVHKGNEGSTVTINHENRPDTELSRLNSALAMAKSEPEAFMILQKIHHARKHAKEAQWDVAERMLKEAGNAQAKNR